MNYRRIFIFEKKNILFCLCFCIIYLYQFSIKNINISIIDSREKQLNIIKKKMNITNYDTYEVYKFNEIKHKLEKTKCSQMWANQKEFLNGIIRKFKPKKVLELGVAGGGSSIII